MAEALNAVEEEPARPWSGIVDWVVRLLAGREDHGLRTSLRVGLIAVLLALLHGTQPPESLLAGDPLNLQEHHPFSPNSAAPASHAAKVAFRLTMPLLGRVLHLDRIGYAMVLFVAGVALFTGLHRVLLTRSGSVRYATLCCVALAFSYVGGAFVADYIFFDGIAVLLAASAVVVGSVAGAAGLVFLALFTDERALIAVVTGALAFRVVTGTWRVGGLALGVSAYALARLGLQATTDLTTHTEGVGLAITRDLAWRAPVGILATWSSVWLLIARGASDLRRRPIGRLLVVAFVAATLSAVLVYDVTRSALYALPAVVAGLIVLHRHRPIVAERTAIVAVMLGLCLPAATVIEDLFFSLPLPYHVVRLILT